ncbi:hypothetical protein SADUNF_Sadunf04G0020100 [Salix dunnii]|uniref:Uncharacterized protein n=1 Tax=Salix dunnii TaxID=1413687 RepID=A0A835KCT9_9ROSI|nr:hypothetical protein SADUNF_Sadunf04G0020100 [Salix dunnii]
MVNNKFGLGQFERNWRFGHEVSLIISHRPEILSLEQVVLGFSSYPGSVNVLSLRSIYSNSVSRQASGSHN